MRVLYLDYTNNIGLGGGQRSLALLIRHLPRPEFEPVLCCPANDKLARQLNEGVPIFDLPLSASFRSISRFDLSWVGLASALAECGEAIAGVRRIVREQRIGIIHANNLKMLLLAAAAAPGVPRIWHVRDIYPRRRTISSVLRIGHQMATEVICVSQAVAAQFPASPKVQVVHNAVELPRLSEAEAREGVTIGYAGRLDHWKGIETLVEAFGRLGRSDVRLLCVGDGPRASLLKDLPAVEHIPFQARMESVWPQFDIAVQPSTEPDPFPRSVIEAMAYAKPVVGSNAGGIPEAIEDGKTGFIFEPGDASGLASRLQTLCADGPRRSAMGAAARAACEAKFTIGFQIGRIAAIYRALPALDSRAA